MKFGEITRAEGQARFHQYSGQGYEQHQNKIWIAYQFEILIAFSRSCFYNVNWGSDWLYPHEESTLGEKR